MFGSAGSGERSPRDLDIGVPAELGQGFDVLGVITELVGFLISTTSTWCT